MKLQKKTLQEIHQAIKKTNSLKAAALFKVAEFTLAKHLGYFRCNKVALSYKFLNALNFVQAIEKFTTEKYKQPLTEKKPLLDQHTLQEIHQVIRSTDSPKEAADLLGVGQVILLSYLGCFHCNGICSSYELLKGLDFEQAIEKFTAEKYGQLLTEIKPSLDQKTLREIHQAIRSTNSAEEAAHLLGVERVELSKYLVGYRCYEYALSYTALKALDLGLGIKVFTAKKYNRPLTEKKAKFDQQTLRAIHDAIKDANSLEEAADFLCVAPAELLRCLAHFRSNEAELTYNILKGLSSEQVIKAVTLETYNQVLMDYMNRMRYPSQHVAANNINKRNRSDDEAPALDKRARHLPMQENNSLEKESDDVSVDSVALGALLEEDSDADAFSLDNLTLLGDSVADDTEYSQTRESPAFDDFDFEENYAESQESSLVVAGGFFSNKCVGGKGGSTQELQLNTPGYS